MENELEKRLQQEVINATPKVILEELFIYMDEKRIKYEENMFDFNRKIETYKLRINELKKEIENPSDETTVKELKEMKQWLLDYEESIKNAKKEIRLININCSILFKNELKMDKILGYGLE